MPASLVATFSAYGAILAMASGTVYFGSYAALNRAVKEEQKRRDGKKSEAAELFSQKDALKLPAVASLMLLGLYLAFKYLGHQLINVIMTVYFSVAGVVVYSDILHVVFNKLLSGRIAQPAKFCLGLRRSGKGSVLYAFKKHWILNNLLSLALATTSLELMGLDQFKTGFILLAGLFIYDIFWVFGTEVMVSVAQSFDAPVKILFPRSWTGEKMKAMMLGLGDIVIPGIFIAFCLRYDHDRARNKEKFETPYFTASLLAYVLGLVVTIGVMHMFRRAQPALLYLSPACMLSTLAVAYFRGELASMWAYRAHPEQHPTKAANEKGTGITGKRTPRRAKKPSASPDATGC